MPRSPRSREWMLTVPLVVVVSIVAGALLALVIALKSAGLSAAANVAQLISLLSLFPLLLAAASWWWRQRQRRQVAAAGGDDSAVRRIAVSSGNDGTLRLLAVTRGGSVLERQYRQRGGWDPWTDVSIPGRRAYDVAATSPAHGRLDVVAADRAGVLWFRHRDREGWQDWEKIDGSDRIGPVIALDIMNTHESWREFYVVGESFRLGHRGQRIGYPWSQWYDRTREKCLDVAVHPCHGRLQCAALDCDGRVWHRDGATEWVDLGTPSVGSPAVAISSLRGETGHQEVFVVSRSGEIGHRSRWHEEPWDPWHDMSSPGRVEDIAAGTTNDGWLELIAVDAQGGLWQSSFRFRVSERWSKWEPVAAPALEGRGVRNA